MKLIFKFCKVVFIQEQLLSKLVDSKAKHNFLKHYKTEQHIITNWKYILKLIKPSCNMYTKDLLNRQRVQFYCFTVKLYNSFRCEIVEVFLRSFLSSIGFLNSRFLVIPRSSRGNFSGTCKEINQFIWEINVSIVQWWFLFRFLRTVIKYWYIFFNYYLLHWFLLNEAIGQQYFGPSCWSYKFLGIC